MPPPAVDLRSDTVTRPSDGMRHAMARAVVGDDVLEGDPTTKRLEARVAEMLGHEAALFMPSGTQANQVAIGLACPHGTEIILHADAHIVSFEQAGASALWGVQLRTVQSPGGRVTADSIRPLIRPEGRSLPSTSLISLENTHNHAGGQVTALEEVQRVAALAREHGIAFHLDGARLWNAAAALGVEVAELAGLADTVMVSFSKGLGCPVGSCLAGPVELLTSGVELRRRLGGGMRQSGILAAACLYALDHNADRLLEDHARARRFAAAFEGHPAVTVVEPETNIVMLDLADEVSAPEAGDALADAGVLLSVFGEHRLRAVMHLDVDDADVSRAAEVSAAVLARAVA